MESLKLILKVFIICLALLKSVSSTLQLHKTSEGKEYLIETELKYNWYQAWHECARRDLQLVIIDSEAKNNEIIGLLNTVLGKSHNLWLGGNDEFANSLLSNRTFYWSATGNEFNFTFWSEGSPYGTEEHCVHIWDVQPSYQWNDIQCTAVMGFICEENHYSEMYNKEFKNKCEAVKQPVPQISTESDKTYKDKIDLLNLKLQNVNSVIYKWKKELEQLQSNTEVSIQKILYDQQYTANQLIEKMVKQVNDLNGELGNYPLDIISQFGGKSSFPSYVKNILVFNNGK